MTRVWIWVWTIPACEGGDLDAIVAKAKAHGVGLIVKTHDGATFGGAWDPQGVSRLLIQKCLDAGVPVRSWGYCYPNVNPDVQAAFAFAPQVGYVADVEGEWDDQPDAARRFADALSVARAKAAQVADVRGRPVSLAYAPLPIVSLHNGGQYAEFNRVCDYVAPQAYAGTGRRDAIGALQWTEQEWQTAFADAVIEPAIYAADQDSGSFLAAMLYVFGKVAQHQRTFGDGSLSIWSYQHMTSEHWAAVEAALAQAVPPPPPAPFVPPPAPPATTPPPVTSPGCIVSLALALARLLR